MNAIGQSDARSPTGCSKFKKRNELVRAQIFKNIRRRRPCCAPDQSESVPRCAKHGGYRCVLSFPIIISQRVVVGQAQSRNCL